MAVAGPVVAGPAGILQPVADFFKLVGKEEITPAFADRFVFSRHVGLLPRSSSLSFLPVDRYN